MKYLVLHCTATKEGREVTSDEIRHWHTDLWAKAVVDGSKLAIPT